MGLIPFLSPISIVQQKLQCLCHAAISICPSAVNQPVESLWNSDPMLFQELLKTSVLFALEKKVSDMPDHLSIESSTNLCVKVEISPTTTVLVVNQFTETSSPTKTSNSSTPDQVSSQWPTQVQTPTVPNFSFALSRLHGWTASMSFLDLLSKKLKELVLKVEKLLDQSRLKLLDNSKSRANWKLARARFESFLLPPLLLILFFMCSRTYNGTSTSKYREMFVL